MNPAYQTESKGSEEKFVGGEGLGHTVTSGTGGYEDNIIESQERQVHPDEGFDESYIKSIRRKVDWRLVPPLAALYAISLIDRTNISLAAQLGMVKQLQLYVDDRYSHAVIAFFPPYIALELFSNLGLRKVGARWWLPTACLLWGIALLGMGFVNNWQGLTALRAVVGIFEAALFPGATYLLSCWYLRKEMARRLTAFYMVGVAASGISSILAYGFAQITTGTIRGWRWIFIGEALLSIAIAVPCYKLIVDFPDSHRCTFLTEEEKKVVTTRIQRDRADAQLDTFSWAKMGSYAMDLKLWAFAICFGFSTTGSYALSYFAPQIIASMGFVGKDIYLLIIPPYVAALPWGMGMAIFSDKTGRRIPFIQTNAAIALLGCALFAFLPRSNIAGRYIGLFLACASVNSNVALVSTASQSAIRKQTKRAFTSALVVGFGGLGGIISGLIFREKDAPSYKFGMVFVLAFQAAIIVITSILALWFMHCNRLANRGQKIIEGHPAFRYQI
ncbi:unnamed protein product [Sympodiomycopsis kandeliae]